MGAAISNSTYLLVGEIVAAILILVAGTYFFKPLTNKDGLGFRPPGKNALKNKKKKDGKKLKGPGEEGGLQSSIDTLVAEDSDAAVASSSKTRGSSVTSRPSTSTAVESNVTTSQPKSKKGKARATTNSTTPTPSGSTILIPPTRSADAGPLSSDPGTSGASSVVDDDGWTQVGRVSEKEGRVDSSNKANTKTPKQDERQTLAEKLLPKPAPTAVDDMLEEKPGLARVIRVKQDEQPAAGFSWGDYEDVERSRASQDEDDGWSSVPLKSRKPARRDSPASGSATPTSSRATTQPPGELSKRQRQNLARREAEKADKADLEKERLATLAKHKRELENERMREQFKKR